jgi:hypothetical protein
MSLKQFLEVLGRALFFALAGTCLIFVLLYTIDSTVSPAQMRKEIEAQETARLQTAFQRDLRERCGGENTKVVPLGRGKFECTNKRGKKSYITVEPY